MRLVGFPVIRPWAYPLAPYIPADRPNAGVHSTSIPTLMRLASLSLLLVAASSITADAQTRQQGRRDDPHCAPDNGGITLPSGFCATIFADSVRGARHLTVAPNGDVFVATYSGRPGTPGAVVALRDTNGDGRADLRESFGEFRSSEVALFDGHIYAENSSAILRWPIVAGSMTPSGPIDTVVSGLPPGGHFAKTFTIDRNGALYVNIGSRTNSCQQSDRTSESPGVDPCTELETRGGIWKFDARKLNQTAQSGEHFARGIRNAVAITINPGDGDVWVMQHGRDQLGGPSAGNWSKLYTAEQNAESPGEEMFHVQKGDNFGWPYCYFDTELKQKLLAPEYGGDRKTVGRCASMKGNVTYFPGHWAPNGLLFYTGTMLPAKYRNGAFVAFHGSWNRAPLPPGGYKVVFQPMKDGKPSGAYEVFADNFRPEMAASTPSVARRPVGLAQGPDGALYITADEGARVWKVYYMGR